MVAEVAPIRRTDADLWEAVAAILEPRELTPPSQWAEANVTLTKEQSPHRPGPFRCDWKPWGYAIHDLLYYNPAKKGLVAIKPAQIGFTRGVLNLLGCYCDTRPGPFLFLISDKQQAGHFASEHWDPMVKHSPRLRELFASVDGERRELVLEKPYRGGRLDFAGAGSVSAVTSRTYTVVAIDEVEIFMDNFPAHLAGSGWTLAEARTSAVPHIGQVLAWSHPRNKGEGIHKLYEDLTDMQSWVWDCPHCETAIKPDWAMVHFAKTELDGAIDPDSARLRCPHCGEEITDAQRAKTVWPSSLGGTGRFVSELDQAEAAKREYIGVAIHRLSDPDVTVRALARKFVAARDDRERKAFYNTTLGEPFVSAAAVVTIELVESRIERVETIAVPGGRFGCRYLTVGADVQYPKENPTLYIRASAWSTGGVEYVVDMAKLTGWGALSKYLRELAVPYQVDGVVAGKLYPRLLGIDCAAFTGQVLDFCRLGIDHAEGNHRIHLLPLRFAPHVRAEAPALMPSEERRTDPTRKHLGPIDLYDLHRHTWVDRQLRRYGENRIVVLCQVPPDYSLHCTANVLVPVKDIHGWGNPNQEWSLIPKRRDDWLMAGVYGEAGAALELKLDRLHELAFAAEERSKRRRERPDEDSGPGFLDRGRRGGGDYWGDGS